MKNKSRKFILCLLPILLLLTSGTKVGLAASPAANTEDSATRSKNIKFDDEVVEGMNKNPLDALESMADRDRRKNNHLYRKKATYHNKMKEQSSEAGYTP